MARATGNRDRPTPRLSAWPGALLGLLCASLLAGGADPKPLADPTLPGRRLLCFPPGMAAKVYTHRADGVVLWTDSPKVGKELLAEIVATGT